MECPFAGLLTAFAITIDVAIAITIVVVASAATIHCRHHHRHLHAVLPALMDWCGLERIKILFFTRSVPVRCYGKKKIQSNTQNMSDMVVI